MLRPGGAAGVVAVVAGLCAVKEYPDSRHRKHDRTDIFFMNRSFSSMFRFHKGEGLPDRQTFGSLVAGLLVLTFLYVGTEQPQPPTQSLTTFLSLS